MQRVFIWLSFKGTNYRGWQIQPDAVTVQSFLNKALSLVFNEDIRTTGAGRTDTGVHASYFVAHFDTLTFEPGNKPAIIYRLNSILPGDIRVHKIKEVPDSWHARYSAVKRTYHYVIAREKTAFNQELSTFIHGDLNISEMQLVALQMLDINDFSCFARVHGGSKTSICKVYESLWLSKGNYLVYKVTADRFLRNMVRAMVGTMIKVGMGKIGMDNFRQIVLSGDRCEAGPSADASALFLTFIEYPSAFKFDDKEMSFPEFLME